MDRQWRESEHEEHEETTATAELGPGKRSGTANAPNLPVPGYPGKRSLTQHFLPRTARTPPRPSLDDVATAAVEGKGTGRPIDPAVRAKVEPHVGASLADVVVHDDDASRAATTAMGARAFAHGRDIFLGEGESDSDLRLMAHELAHVVQQGAARTAIPQRKVAVGDSHSPAEAQADTIAERVISGAPGGALLVDAGPVGEGQMLTSELVTRLRGEVDAILRGELGALGAALSRPVIELYFGRYTSRTAAASEQLIRQYVPAAASARTAEQLVPAIVARLREAIHHWRETGETPADLPVEQAAASAGMVAAPPGSAAAMVAELGPGQPLDGAVAQRMGQGFGASFEGVMVHTGPEAARKTAEVGATALTVGTHIGFAQGKFEPGTELGDALLAHELAHVEQQRGADPKAMRAPLGGESSAAEVDADRAAGGALQRLLAGKTGEKASLMKTGLQLQRCSGTPSTPPDPFLVGLQTKLAAGNKAGAFADLVGLGGSRAGDAALRSALRGFQATGQLTVGEALRALVIVELGADGTGAAAWPVEVRNLVDGVGDGVFTVNLATLPTGRAGLRELAVVTAGTLANGAGVRGEYQAQFDGKWAIATESTALDPSLDSKGPRNPRARRIFNELYREARFKTAYDTNAPAGFREFCDTYAGPTSLNLIASPRLEAFRAAFGGVAIPAATTADAAYTSFVTTTITPLLSALDAGDHAAIEGEPARWQTLYESKLRGSSPAVIRDFLAVVSGAAPAAPRARSPLSAPPAVTAPPVSPSPGSGTPPPPGTPAAPNATEQAWLRSITIAGPATVDVESRNVDIDFDIRSTTPNPSLVVEREVSITPAAQAVDGTDQSREVWAVGSSSQPHTATIDPTTTAASGITNVVAELTMPPHGAHFPAKRSAPVVVRDKRLDMVRRDINPGLSFNEFDRYVNRTTPALTYYGGQLTVRVDPWLPTSNPGLNLFVSGEIKKGGAVVPGGAFPLAPFRQGTDHMRLGELLLQQAPGGAVGAKDTFQLSVRYQVGPSGAPFHSPAPITFEVRHGALNAAPTAADTSLLTADTAALAAPGAATAPAGNARSTVLEFLRFPPTTLNAAQQANCRRVAAAVSSGTVPLLPMFVRSDSATLVTASGGDPATQVAYALGSLAPVDVLIERPGWAGWQAWRGPAIYVNRTPDPLNRGQTRSIEEMAMFAAHEAIHSVDDPPANFAAPDPFHRYRMEFRAYWVDGRYENLTTDRDESLTFGPKSPRANAIFQHIYSSYDYTTQAYDQDANGFRSRVDNYLYPDGINLIASAQLAALKTAVRDTTGAFAARHARVSAAFTACTATDRAEIRGNRAWRDDVEANFGTTVSTVPGSSPPRTEAERDQIKRLLGIPL